MVFEILKVHARGMFTSARRIGITVRKAAHERAKLHDQLTKIKAKIEEKDKTNAPEKELTKAILEYDKTLKKILKETESESTSINIEEDNLVRELTEAEKRDQELSTRYSGKVDLREVNAEFARIHKRVRNRIQQIQLTAARAMSDRTTVQAMLSRFGQREQRILRQFRREVKKESKADTNVLHELNHLEKELKQGNKEVDTSKLLTLTKNLGSEMERIFAQLYYLTVFLANEHHTINEATKWDLTLLERLQHMKLTPQTAVKIQTQIQEIKEAQKNLERTAYKLARRELKGTA